MRRSSSGIAFDSNWSVRIGNCAENAVAVEIHIGNDVESFAAVGSSDNAELVVVEKIAERLVGKVNHGTSQYNSAFVLMQYFGYLRRDVEQAGFDFWLDVVNNREPNNYRGMVCSFITSTEYQLRFGAVVTRSNQDCGR